jgi:hypothetical protein
MITGALTDLATFALNGRFREYYLAEFSQEPTVWSPRLLPESRHCRLGLQFQSM